MTSAPLSARDPSPSSVGGVVYTPARLAAFVVDCLLDDASLLPGRWLDPACGEGVFLVEAVRRLAAFGAPDALSAMVETALFGFDIDVEACERTRRAVRDEVQRHAGQQREDFFAANVRTADFLRLDPAQAGSFDAVVGNPPYVSATQLSPARKQELLRHFETAWGRLDLYGLFFEQGTRLLTPGGRLAFITPDKFLTAESARPLRAYLSARCPPRQVARFDRHDLFPRVAIVPAVTVLERPTRTSRSPATSAWWDMESDGTLRRRTPSLALTTPTDGRPWQSALATRTSRRATVPLGTLVTRISAGLATGLNGCFVLSATEAEVAALEPTLLRPAVRGRDIRAGAVEDSDLRLLLPYVFDSGGPPRLADLAAHPRAAAHFAAHRTDLERRHCVRVWRKRWYDLHDPVVCDLAARPKLLVPDLAKASRFAFDPGTVVPLHSAYYLEPASGTGFEPRALAAVLNTAELEAELLRLAPLAKSGYRRFRAQFLRELPIPRLTACEQDALLSRGADAGACEPIAWSLARDAA